MALFGVDLESVTLLKSIETLILETCLQSPTGSITMAQLLDNQNRVLAMPGLYVMAATNLCVQGKVRLQQEEPKDPNNLEQITITLIN